MTGNQQAGAHRPVIASMRSPAGVTLSYERYGKGPPLVLVHGSFSDHRTNWEFVAPLLGAQFTVYAIARRGRGLTSATEGHSIEDEAADLIALIRSIGGLVNLLGHSYGAHVALAAAARMPACVRNLILYEAPWPHLMDDAKASRGDVRALSTYQFDAERFRGLSMPVLLQTGSESPRDLYVTDALAAVLSDVRVETLEGQAHEGMTTAPEQYAEAISRFLKG